MRDPFHQVAIEIWSVHRQLDGIDDTLAGEEPNHGEHHLRPDRVALVQNREAHGHSFSAAAARAARACSCCRVAWPTAPQTTSSKIWSSLRPAARTAATSWLVTV